MEKVNKVEAERLFSIIRGEKGNDRCFDCGKGGPTWVSLRHAVFVCTECAANHRAIGLRLKSILLDTFTADDFKRIRLGGNFRFGGESFEKKYKKLKDHPENLDRIVESNVDEAQDPAREEEAKLEVKLKLVPKFGKKVENAGKKTEASSPEKAKPSNVKSTSIQREELMINRKEYKISEISRSRMGFGASKIKKTGDESK